jgi:cellulose synthase/poly-beta-1,6-N-acetylglucosamine synthase-like glycosyltransferase
VERKGELEALLNGGTFKECDSIIGRRANIKAFSEQVKQQSATGEKKFLSAGLWLTTVIFLALSCIFALVSCFFSFLNIFWRPFRTLTSAFGLYIWNLIAAIICLLTMIFWLSLYFIFITNNIAITDTLLIENGYSSKGMSRLGFSFWIMIISICCHIANIGVVYYRNIRLQQEPKTPVIKLKKNESDDQPEFY